MKINPSNIDVNALPVHLFVKCPREAKKIQKQSAAHYYNQPDIYKRSKRFSLVQIH